MIYLDNAATSWPKPEAVGLRMEEVLRSLGGNPGRGGHNASLQTARLIYGVREQLAEMLEMDDPQRVIFTSNATHAINQALFGLLKPGDHVITTSMEHNAVSRPLHALSQKGVEVTELKLDPDGDFPWEEYDQAFRPETQLVVTLHASNVTGNLLPVKAIGAVAHRHQVLYLLDASQSAGVFPLSFKVLPVDLIAFPGHKSLLGPQGTGVLALGESVNGLRPLLYGGTGSLSEQDEQPDFLPDALESGTLNGVGIAGLGAALSYLKQTGIDQIRRAEQQRCAQLIQGLKMISGIKIYGGTEAELKAPIVSFNLGDLESSYVAYALEQTAGVIARAGLHCAPHAHATLGTLEQGVVRLSPSHFTTGEEIEKTLEAVHSLAREIG